MNSVEFSEILRNWAIVVGGVVGLGLAYWRGAAHNRQAVAQQQQATIAQRAHVAEVFKDAVAQLGDDKFEIRLGAVLTLKRIAEDFPDFDGPVVELLTAYVRERADDYIDQQVPSVEIYEIIKLIQRDQMEK